MTLHFAHPSVLFALVLPAILLGWVWRRRGRSVAVPFDHGRAGRGRGLRVLLDIAESLPAVLLAVAIVILAGPLRLSAPRTKRVLTNIDSMGERRG